MPMVGLFCSAQVWKEEGVQDAIEEEKTAWPGRRKGRQLADNIRCDRQYYMRCLAHRYCLNGDVSI